jgi:chemotaxis protein methyltransferase CheR
MEYSIEYEIGIIDYRNIIKAINESYNYDFSDYALTSLKRRIERSIQYHNIKHVDILIERLHDDKLFFDQFLQELAIESTEMFRDPSFWRYLRDELLPLIFKDIYRPKIWLPFCVSGDELYTLAIVLTEEALVNNTEIIVTCQNDLIIDQIKKGLLRNYKVEVSNDNYTRYQGKGHLSDYYILRGEQAIRDSSLIKNVSFIKQNINFDNSPQDVKLILCRNQLIYYTQSLHDRVLKIFNDSLMTGGYLVLGAREQVGLISSKYFRIVNEAESVYKKF